VGGSMLLSLALPLFSSLRPTVCARKASRTAALDHHPVPTKENTVHRLKNKDDRSRCRNTVIVAPSVRSVPFFRAAQRPPLLLLSSSVVPTIHPS